MTQQSKSSGLKRILAGLALIAALIFFGIVLKDRFFAQDEMAGPGQMDGGQMDGGQMDGNGLYRKLQNAGQGLVITDSYARSNGASAQAGAVFMVIRNYADEEDRLVSATADVSKKAMVHSNKMDATGLSSMTPVMDGLKIPAHTEAALKRGGYHVMLMGLKRSLKQGDTVKLSLDFEKAGSIIVLVPVDLKR